jgi:hypothetical protein
VPELISEQSAGDPGERGAYQFRNCPSRYTVGAELRDSGLPHGEPCHVNADATTRGFAARVRQLEEGVIVKGRSPLMDTTSTLNQTVLSARSWIRCRAGTSGPWDA